MPRRRRQSKRGTVVRGADGLLYYIPANQMKSLRLPAQDTASVRSVLDMEKIKAHGKLLPAFHARGLANKFGEVTSIDLADVKKLTAFSSKKNPRS